MRKLFIDFYEHSYKLFDPNTQLHLPEGQSFHQWLEYTFDKVENNLCGNDNQQNCVWHCYAIKSSNTSTDDYIAFILIKDEKEFHAVYFAQYAVIAGKNRTPMVELLQHIRTEFPEQKMIGVGRRINEDGAEFFARNGAKLIENDETIAIRHGYDPKDYVACQYY